MCEIVGFVCNVLTEGDESLNKYSRAIYSLDHPQSLKAKSLDLQTPCISNTAVTLCDSNNTKICGVHFHGVPEV